MPVASPTQVRMYVQDFAIGCPMPVSMPTPWLQISQLLVRLVPEELSSSHSSNMEGSSGPCLPVQTGRHITLAQSLFATSLLQLSLLTSRTGLSWISHWAQIKDKVCLQVRTILDCNGIW